MSTINTTIRFAKVIGLDGRNIFYLALRAEDWGRFTAAYADDQSVAIEKYEFTDQAIVEATEVWIKSLTLLENRPVLAVLGSTEDGVWVDWNLDTPRPRESAHVERRRTTWPQAVELQRAADTYREVAPDITGPLAGLADPVADWLDETANTLAWLAPYRPHEPGYAMWGAALRVARIVNGDREASRPEEI